MDKFIPIHKHLLLKGNPTKTFTDPEQGKQMLRDVVAAIHMVPVTEPQCVYVGVAGNEGLTGSINLATSHIAFHMWDVDMKLQLDVYSCCEFDPEVVLTVLHKHYGQIKNLHAMVIDRSSFDALMVIDRP